MLIPSILLVPFLALVPVLHGSVSDKSPISFNIVPDLLAESSKLKALIGNYRRSQDIIAAIKMRSLVPDYKYPVATDAKTSSDKTSCYEVSVDIVSDMLYEDCGDDLMKLAFERYLLATSGYTNTADNSNNSANEVDIENEVSTTDLDQNNVVTVVDNSLQYQDNELHHSSILTNKLSSILENIHDPQDIAHIFSVDFSTKPLDQIIAQNESDTRDIMIQIEWTVGAIKEFLQIDPQVKFSFDKITMIPKKFDKLNSEYLKIEKYEEDVRDYTTKSTSESRHKKVKCTQNKIQRLTKEFMEDINKIVKWLLK